MRNTSVMNAGYSRTRLAQKLGIKADSQVSPINAPAGFRALLDPLPEGVNFRDSLRGRSDIVVLFVMRRSELERRIAAAGRTIFPNGGVWVAWPKKASGIKTDMTEDVVREIALPTGLVDNKVCAIDEIWSGLRVVWRKHLRTTMAS
jgi:hypothetical protein